MRRLGAGAVILSVIFGLWTPLPVVAASESAWRGEFDVEKLPTNFETTSYCPTFQVSLLVQEFSSPQSLCLFIGENITFATFFANGSTPTVAVKLPYQTVFHRVRGVCEGVAGCVYAPETDRFVTWRRKGGTEYSLLVYEKVTSYLRREVTNEYRFVSEDPPKELKDSSGSLLSVGAFGLSRNGRWAAIELRDRGIGLLDLDLFELRRVSPVTFSYGSGMDSRPEMTVSNDGSLIAQGGERSSLLILRISPECGDGLPPGLTTLSPGSVSCPRVPIAPGRLADPFDFATHLAFDAAATSLRLYATSLFGNPQRIVISPSGSVDGKVGYLALGDSFASGEGETDDRYYVFGTNMSQEKCHVSRRSYAFLLAPLMQDEIYNIACSGAKLKDVIGVQNYLGQSDRLVHLGIAQDIARAEALDRFLPGRIPQSWFVERFRPKIVSIGIGGNDVGLMTKLRACIGPNTCEWVKDQASLARSGGEIRRLYEPLVTALKMLQEQSPLSRFRVVSYPLGIDPQGRCDPVTALLLNSNERQFVDQAMRYLNMIIKSAAQAAGVLYADIQSAFGKAVLCGEEPSMMNGLRGGDDVSLLQSSSLKVIGAESYHPKPEGHRRIAEILSDSFANQLAECSGCASSPLMPSYFEGTEEYRQQAGDFLEKETLLEGEKLALHFPPLTFQPLSDLSIEVHSQPTTLGRLRASEDGSIQGTLSLPPQFEAGQHVVHVFGDDYEGEKVDFYQEFRYEERSSAESTKDDSSVISSLPAFSGTAESVLGIAHGLSRSLATNFKEFISKRTWVPLLFIIAGLAVTGFLVWRWFRDRGG